MLNRGKVSRRSIQWLSALAFCLVGGALIVGPMLAQQVTTEVPEPRAQEERVVPASAQPLTVEESLRREMAAQQRRHAERLRELETLKKGLQAADAREEQVTEVDRLMEDEIRDYQARVRFLRQISEPSLAANELPESRLRSTIDSELRDVARAIGSLNQSYAIAPVVGPGAATGGSGFVDFEDVPDDRVASRPPVRHAPPPRVLDDCGCGRACWGKCPPWLYGEVPCNWIPPAAADELIRSIRKLHEEVARLRADLEQVQDRPTPAAERPPAPSPSSEP